jgi:hypothetical protein
MAETLGFLLLGGLEIPIFAAAETGFGSLHLVWTPTARGVIA